jgi:hypothetical protein
MKNVEVITKWLDERNISLDQSFVASLQELAKQFKKTETYDF